MSETKVNLLCLPFAGGNKYSYRDVFRNLPSHIRPITLEPPGRGERIREVLLKDLYAISQDILLKAANYLNANTPYIIFGHSMGALVSYLLVHQIMKANLPLPMHLFVSGSAGPSFKRTHRYADLPKKELIEKLTQLGGCPEELLKDDGLFDFFESIIRADFQAIETFTYNKALPVNVPISILIGDEDKYTLEDVNLWIEESCQDVDIQLYPGGHFFLFEQSEKICEHINQKIDSKLLERYDVN